MEGIEEETNYNMEGTEVSEPTRPTPTGNMEEQMMSIFTSPQFIRVLADRIKEDMTPNPTSLTKNVETSSSSDITEVIRNKQVHLPAFNVTLIDAEDKLRGHINFRPWKQRLERDMLALGRSNFLKHPLGGEDIVFTMEEKHMYDAQVRQYLEATLQNGPRALITNEATAADAFVKLEKMFGKNDVQKMVELLDNFGKIALHPKMNPMAFVTKFENAVQQFQELGVPLDPKIIVAYFLHKVRHIRPFMGFYTTIATLPEATRTYEFVRNTFLDVASSNYSLEMENSKYNQNDDVDVVCSECINTSEYSFRPECDDVVTICSFCLDSPMENDLTNNTFVAVSCSQCNKGSTNFCDFCVERKMEQSFDEPPRKREKVSTHSKQVTKNSSSQYTQEQILKLKKMSPEERNAVRCSKCGLLFHKASECKTEGRVCFFCYKKGHEKKDCKKLQSLKSKS